MKWQSFGHLFSVLALSAFGLVMTTGCEPEAPEPVERDGVVDVDDDLDDDMDGDALDVDVDADDDVDPVD